MHIFDPGNLVLTPEGVGTVRFYQEADAKYGVELDTTIKQVFLYPAKDVSSIDGKMQALQDMLVKICAEATIHKDSAYLPASLINEANELLSPPKR
jgi:hypothetical protein